MSTRALRTSRPALDKFIETLGQGATVTDACRAAGMAKSTAYDLRQRDEEFVVRWADALEAGTDRREDAALARAVDGCEEPVWHQGVQVGTVREYDSQLLMFLLRASRPEKCRERAEIGHQDAVNQPSAAELARLRKLGEDPEYRDAAELIARKLGEMEREERDEPRWLDRCAERSPRPRAPTRDGRHPPAFRRDPRVPA